MTTAELITAAVLFLLAAVCAAVSGCSFAERGFLFNNAYIFASAAERANMNKKPYYRQTAIVFCLLCAVFLVIGLALVLHNSKIQLLEIPLFAGVFLYAVISSVMIEKRLGK